MYNSIYPININYTKHNQYKKNTADNSASQSSAQTQVNQDNNQSQNTFPNGAKVAIDYTKGQINISQVLTDFRSTILAINAPDDVSDEVSIYLNLVDKESKKENPSREIIVANLKNASRISDAYIAKALNKQSNVVEKWIDTLFLQRINLKADPNEINPDFQLEFPKNAQERIEAQKQAQNESVIEQHVVAEAEEEKEEETVESHFELADSSSEIKLSNQTEVVDVESEFELAQEEIKAPATIQKQTPFSPKTQADIEARALFARAKALPQTNQGDIEAINLLNEALGIMNNDLAANKNIRAAIHIERGKIFDSYDYVDYALRDYYEATKADDFNLKAQAHYKSGQIYDEFSEFYPAMDNYFSSVAYSAEAENIDAQTRVLSKIASLYTKQFDVQRASEFGDLAIETAQNSNNSELLAQTYSTDAQNSQYLGQNDRALDSYKNALSIFPRNDESFEQMAYNYEQAAIVMRKLGNHAKAAKLQLKANQYYQKAQLAPSQLEQAG